MVSRPVITQVRSRPPAEPVCRGMSAVTIKMPEPIIEPTTIIVPSNNPMARTKPGSWFAAPCETACVRSLMAPGVSDGGRMIGGCQYVNKLTRPLCRIGCEENIADDRDAVGARANDFGGSLDCDTADGHNGLVRERANRADKIDAYDGIGVGLGDGRKHRPDGNVVGRSRSRALELLQVVSRNARPLACCQHAARLLHSQILLAKVDAGGFRQCRDVGAVIHQERDALRSQLRRKSP